MLGRAKIKGYRSILALAALVLALLWLAGCGGTKQPQEGQQPAKAPETKAPESAGQAQGTSSREQELAKLIEGAKAEGKVVWGDGLKPEEAEPVIKTFNAKYPFIAVEHTRINGTDSRERLLREMMAGTYTFDVFDVGGEEVPTFRQAGVLEEYDWTKAFNIPQEMLAQDKTMVAYGGSVKVVGYNTNLIKQEELPQTWEDLLDSKWQGKIVVDSRPKSFLQLMPVWGEEKVLDYLQKLAANKPQYRRGQTESIQLMAAGEISLIAGTYYHSMKLVQDKGAPIESIILEPVPLSLDEEAVAKKAAHPNAAKLLLGFLATEGQKAFDQASSRGLPFPGYDTNTARLVNGKKLSIFDETWVAREAELSKKAQEVMGLE